tara:strand:+ start:1620 stop:2645 length:1026 start_codon:yes stop_codon:yes gene_type:complete
MPGSHRVTKHTVLTSGLHDADIRPPELLSELVRLSERDATLYFGAAESLQSVPCPACDTSKNHCAFTKNGFDYARCAQCTSLFVNPRPRTEDLARYYKESEASHFRTAQFGEETASQRRVHLLRSLASWMGQLVDLGEETPEFVYGDVGSSSPFLFDEVAELGLFSTLHSLEPLVPIAACCGPSVVEHASIPAMSFDVLSAFQKLEHQQSPLDYLQGLHACLKPEGMLFLTTRTCSGFDVQVLGEKAAYFYVPEHLNLLSIDGLELLVQRSGFELIELSTPGQLDVELVLQTCASDPTVALPPFLRALIHDRGELAHRDFQAFLQKHRLSSHVRLALRKSG